MLPSPKTLSYDSKAAETATNPLLDSQRKVNNDAISLQDIGETECSVGFPSSSFSAGPFFFYPMEEEKEKCFP